MTTDLITGGSFARIAELPLSIDEVGAEQLALAGGTAAGERLTTLVTLSGGGETGRGEDVSYMADTQRALLTHVPTLALAGSWTIAGLSAHLDSLQLAPGGGDGGDDHDAYHRWAIESAALDLALRQAGSALPALLEREYAPVRFCVSMGLGKSPDARRVLDWLEIHPGLTFKLDASSAWDAALIAELAATRAVRVIDLKGRYTGAWIDNDPDPELVARLTGGFGDRVIIEDPQDDGAIIEQLVAAGALVSWDAPITCVADLEALPVAPSAINIKPSRFGSLERLLDAIDWCEERAIPLYGGGQYELGVGRTQIQTIASLFYADADNDTAPAAWHGAEPGADVPLSPLTIPDSPGFGFAAA